MLSCVSLGESINMYKSHGVDKKCLGGRNMNGRRFAVVKRLGVTVCVYLAALLPCQCSSLCVAE